MMDCNRFQETISDYLDGLLEGCAKADFAAHRLRCRACREVFSEVRLTVETLGEFAGEDLLGESTALENRILAATSAGEMLSCRDFDRLIEKYFDGVILAPTFQTFQVHFKTCHQCRRLMAGIDDAIALCHDVKTAEVDLPPSLHDRIMAATVGHELQPVSAFNRWQSAAQNFIRPLWTPQWAAAALIFAASLLFVHSRFGGFGGMAVEAGTQAERLVDEGQQAMTQTGAMAVIGFQMVSRSLNQVTRDKRPAPVPVNFRAEPSAQTTEQLPPPPQQPDSEEPAVTESTVQGGKKRR